jgi:hypothetical protein
MKMNLKWNTLFVVSVGLLLSSCARPTTSIELYANRAAQLVSFEDGLKKELEFQKMEQMLWLQTQQPDLWIESSTLSFQHDWLEIREMVMLVREQQRLQNHQRLLMKMETSILRSLGTVIETHKITLSEEIVTALATSQATLMASKTSIQQDRDAQRRITSSLRVLMRSGNRPSTWTESLINTIKSNLTELLAIQASLFEHLLNVYPSLTEMREILASSVPDDLTPLTEVVLDGLSIFQIQVQDLNTLQSQINLKQQQIRSWSAEIRNTMRTRRENGLSLNETDQVALGVKRLAILDAHASLKELAKATVTAFRSLKGIIHVEHLSEIHATLATVMEQKETFLMIQATMEQHLMEAVAILNA